MTTYLCFNEWCIIGVAYTMKGFVYTEGLFDMIADNFFHKLLKYSNYDNFNTYWDEL